MPTELSLGYHGGQEESNREQKNQDGQREQAMARLGGEECLALSTSIQETSEVLACR